MPDGGFDVAAQLLRQTVHLHLFRFLGGVRQILSINMANNPSRLYKEMWIGLGGTQSAVYATEVSAEEYLAYTTEETEKVEVYRLAEQLGGDIEAAIRQLAERRRNKE